MPAAAYEKEASAAGRVAAFLDFLKLRKKHHVVYLPKMYEKELEFLYEDLGDTRDFRLAEEGIFAEGLTDMRPQIFGFAGIARVAVHAAGPDFPARLAAMEKELREKGVVVTQIWLNLAGPWTGGAAPVLLRNGYFLGGVLPRWFDTDGMLLQKIGKRPDWEGILAITDRYRKILGMVRNDWERSLKERRNGD